MLWTYSAHVWNNLHSTVNNSMQKSEFLRAQMQRIKPVAHEMRSVA